MLTPKEVANIRRFFRARDSKGDGVLSDKNAKLAFIDWYVSIIKRNRDDIPVYVWLGMDDIFPRYDNVVLIGSIRETQWEEFIKRYALYVLCARPNTVSHRPYIPRFDMFARANNQSDDESLS